VTIEIHKTAEQVRRAGDGLVVRAPAKLNLWLRVLGRRPDGFHELDSLVVKVTLADELSLRPADPGTVELSCEGPDCGPVADNLIYRAARLLRPAAAGRGVSMGLVKRVPVGAGLGGGSSDAAAALIGLNLLWELNLSGEKLAGYAAELGSDVPLFLGGPASRMAGRGERIVPAAVGDFRAVLVLPEVACPTGKVYAAYDAAQAGRPAGAPSTAAPADLLPPASTWSDCLHNDLAPAALAVRPELAETADRVERATGRRPHVTGSGSAMFLLADDLEAARRLAEPISSGGLRCCIVRRSPW
jgi:4-diphosphocytidyl-2-C-methyl-D-erythritol kinase